MNKNMEVFSDLSERIKYNLPGFPLYARMNELQNYEQYSSVCHWHPDLEFNFVVEGKMEFFVNGEHLHLKKGEGIFVNSKRLHYEYSKNNSNSTFYCVVIHPLLLGLQTQFGKEYIEQKTASDTDNYILLNGKNDWHNEALVTIKNIYEEMKNNPQNPFRLIMYATKLFSFISDNINYVSQEGKDDISCKAMWQMTGFVQNNYHRKISLEDIASAGAVCRSICCRLFKRFSGRTPNAYLTQYRINKSREMLKETKMTITEISDACGFQSPSYFTYIFQKEYGLSPRDFRDK